MVQVQVLESISQKIKGGAVYQPTLRNPYVVDKLFKWLQLNSNDYNKKKK